MWAWARRLPVPGCRSAHHPQQPARRRRARGSGARRCRTASPLVPPIRDSSVTGCWRPAMLRPLGRPRWRLQRGSRAMLPRGSSESGSWWSNTSSSAATMPQPMSTPTAADHGALRRDHRADGCPDADVGVGHEGDVALDDRQPGCLLGLADARSSTSDAHEASLSLMRVGMSPPPSSFWLVDGPGVDGGSRPCNYPFRETAPSPIRPRRREWRIDVVPVPMLGAGGSARSA